MVNLYTKSEVSNSPTNKIRKATQNVENGVILGLGAPNVIGNITIR